jgi:hypothetical protein
MNGTETKTTTALWASLEAQPFSFLHELAPVDQDRFVLLDDCVRTIIRCFTLLDSEGQCYFGPFRKLAWRILRDVDVGHAYRQAEQELGTGLDWERAFGDPLLTPLHIWKRQ